MGKLSRVMKHQRQSEKATLGSFHSAGVLHLNDRGGLLGRSHGWSSVRREVVASLKWLR